MNDSVPSLTTKSESQPGAQETTAEPYSEAGFQKLDPRHRKLSRLIGGGIALGLVAISLFFLAVYLLAGGEIGLGFAVVALVVFALWLVVIWGGWVYPRLAYDRACWRLGPQGLEIRRGVWWQHQIVVPKSRIQHSDIEQGPLQRSHGIATLVVHTAGTKNSSVQIDGLAIETATELRDALVTERLSTDRKGGTIDGV